MLRGATCIDQHRVDIIYALLRLVLHHGVALLNQLFEAAVSGKEAPNKLRQLQLRRIAARERAKYAFMLNETAVDTNSRAAPYNALMGFLTFDDTRIADEDMVIVFP